MDWNQLPSAAWMAVGEHAGYRAMAAAGEAIPALGRFLSQGWGDALRDQCTTVTHGYTSMFDASTEVYHVDGVVHRDGYPAVSLWTDTRATYQYYRWGHCYLTLSSFVGERRRLLRELILRGRWEDIWKPTPGHYWASVTVPFREAGCDIVRHPLRPVGALTAVEHK